jgi:tripartite-type tricarboxylate transporter receptor subunit TctC
MKLIVAMLLSLAYVAPAIAQQYPAKSLRIVIAFPPAGTTDQVVRPLAQRLSEIFKQSVVVDNRGGAGGNIGGDHVARSAPDGYTILATNGASMATNVSLYEKMSFSPAKDLEPVIALTTTPNMLAVNSTLPVKTVKELISVARAKPGALNYGSSGHGGTNHMAMELFKIMAGVDLLHVPFQGGGPLQTAFLGGTVNVVFNTPSSLIPFAKEGRIRILGVASDTRISAFADIPTIAEQGLPGFESSAYFALFVPRGTPRAAINAINAEVNRILKDEDMLNRFKAVGAYPMGGTPEDLGRRLNNDITTFAKVVHDAKIPLQN